MRTQTHMSIIYKYVHTNIQVISIGLWREELTTQFNNYLMTISHSKATTVKIYHYMLDS